MKIRSSLTLPLVVVLAFAAVASAADKRIFEKKSEYNDIIVTEDDAGVRTLWFELGGSRQSVVKLGDPDFIELPYARAMTVGMAVVEEPKRVLIVGLGGGTIPSFLRKHYPKLAIDIVDIDPAVVTVAKDYFGFKEDDLMKVHVADGRKFIEDSPGRYDIIFLDAFGADNIPYHLATRQFLVSVKRALTPQGIVCANVWTANWNRLYYSMVRTYTEVFDQTYVMNVADTGNRIVIAIPRPGELKLEDLAKKAATVVKEKQYPFDLGAMVTAGFRFPLEEITYGRILLDESPPSPPAE